MSSKKQERKSTSRLTQGLLAASVAALVAMPVALANGADGPVATKSASLAKQVKNLKKRVAALEARQPGTGTTGTTTTATPTGPAGGDLTGTYPNPTIGAGKVDSAKVADGSLTTLDIGDGSLTSFDYSANSVFDVHLANDSVGNGELKSVISRLGAGVTVANNNSNTATVSCAPGEQLIGGGGAYTSNAPGAAISASAPGGANGSLTTQWIVSGVNNSGSSKELVPWATCLIG